MDRRWGKTNKSLAGQPVCLNLYLPLFQIFKGLHSATGLAPFSSVTRSNRAVNWRCGVPGSATIPERLAGLVGVDVAGSVAVGVVGEAAGTVSGEAVVVAGGEATRVVGGVRCCRDPCNRGVREEEGRR